MDTLYRAEYSCYTDGNISICINTYPVIKQTSKGVWIKFYSDRKFVLLAGRKKFAYPTKEEAINSLKRRKQRQLQIIEGMERIANNIIQQIEKKDINEYQIYSTQFTTNSKTS